MLHPIMPSSLHYFISKQISLNRNPLRCDPDLCWLMDEAWTTRFKVTIDATPCRTPWDWLTYLGRGSTEDHVGCETGTDKQFTKDNQYRSPFKEK